MSTQVLRHSGRVLTLTGLPLGTDDLTERPSAVLVPAYTDQDIELTIDAIEKLVKSGCREFCCVGPSAEFLHDKIDEILEGSARGDVITTFHSDEIDACEYFLFAANGAIGNLLALVKRNALLLKALQEEINADC